MGYLDEISANNKPNYAEKTVVKHNEKVKAVGWITAHSSAIFVGLLLVVGVICTLIASFNSTPTVDLQEITISGIIFSAVVYAIFIECTSSGKQQYLEGSDSVKTEKEYSDEIRDIEEKNLAGLIETFCELYVQEKLDRARKKILSRVKLTLEDYELFLRDKNHEQKHFSKKQLKYLKKAHHVKPIRLNEEMIYHASADYEDGSPIRSSGKIYSYIIFKYISKFITTVASLFFTFSIGYELVTNLTPEVILRSIIQITIMISTIFGGLKFGAIQMQKWNDQKKDIIRVLKTFRRWEKQGKLKEPLNTTE